MLWAVASRDPSARQSRRTRSHPPPLSASEGVGGARGLGNLVRPESHPEPRGFPVRVINFGRSSSCPRIMWKDCSNLLYPLLTVSATPRRTQNHAVASAAPPPHQWCAPAGAPTIHGRASQRQHRPKPPPRRAGRARRPPSCRRATCAPLGSLRGVLLQPHGGAPHPSVQVRGCTCRTQAPDAY